MECEPIIEKLETEFHEIRKESAGADTQQALREIAMIDTELRKYSEDQKRQKEMNDVIGGLGELIIREDKESGDVVMTRRKKT